MRLFFVCSLSIAVIATGCENTNGIDAPDGVALSFNDPHLPSGNGPWFEGWYARITDLDGSRSVAIIAASHKPRGVEYEIGDPMPGYLAVLISDGDGAPTRSFEVFPEETSVRAAGEPVDSNPDLLSPADFEWSAPGFGRVTEDEIDIDIPGAVSLSAQMGLRLPWNDCFSEAGPEGILAFLPVPLHWHISSLGSPAEYAYEIADDGTSVASEGYAHLEKNWGKVFPIAWSWGQGIAGDNDAQFVYGGGRVRLFGDIVIEPWIVGYRSENLEWDFRPTQPGVVIHTKIDACAGKFSLKAKDSTRTLELYATAPPGTYGDVSMPTTEGFVPFMGGESFSAEVTIRTYRHTPWAGLFGIERFVEETTFQNSALEFGADYICDN